jgi:hypothetical protein
VNGRRAPAENQRLSKKWRSHFFEKMHPAARRICLPQTDKFHTCRARGVFCHVHAAAENKFHPFRACGRSCAAVGSLAALRMRRTPCGKSETFGLFQEEKPERSGLCDDAAGPVIVFGTLASVLYGIVLLLLG